MRPFKALFLALAVCLAGCSAMQTAMEFSDLELVSNTRRPVFLRNGDSRNLFLTVDCPVQEWGGIPSAFAEDLMSKGYNIVTSRDEADIIMAVQLRGGEIEKHSARAVQQGIDFTSSTAALAGGGIGYLASHGDPVTAIASGLGGLVVGGLTDVTINSWVYMGILQVQGDVLVVERLDAQKSEWWSPVNNASKETETAVTVRAKQAGLEWKEVASPIGDKLLAELVSILPAKK